MGKFFGFWEKNTFGVNVGVKKRKMFPGISKISYE